MSPEDLLDRAGSYFRLVEAADPASAADVAALRRTLALFAAEAEPWALFLALASVSAFYAGAAGGDAIGALAEYAVKLNAQRAVRGRS